MLISNGEDDAARGRNSELTSQKNDGHSQSQVPQEEAHWCRTG